MEGAGCCEVIGLARHDGCVTIGQPLGVTTTCLARVGRSRWRDRAVDV